MYKKEYVLLPSPAHDIADPDQETMGFVVLLYCQKRNMLTSVKVAGIPPKMAVSDISGTVSH